MHALNNALEDRRKNDFPQRHFANTVVVFAMTLVARTSVIAAIIRIVKTIPSVQESSKHVDFLIKIGNQLRKIRGKVFLPEPFVRRLENK